MKKRIPIIILLLVLFLLIGSGVYFHFDSKTRFNDDYVNGNTTGNLYNAGLFCEADGTIYFANPSDEYRLYSMELDGSNLKKLSSDTASYINVDEHYIYYVRNNAILEGSFSFLSYNTDSLCRIDRDGDKGSELVLDTEPCMYASLFGNYIYYLHYDTEDATSLYKVKIDGTEQQMVDQNPYFTAAAAGQYLYYNGLENDHYIWRMDTLSDTSSVLVTGNCWMPTVTDGAAFYMDCENDYAITKVDLSTSEVTCLSEDRVDFYNICGNYIYFQRSDAETPALCRMRLDGSDYEVITEGVFTDINATSQYVYFRQYSSDIMFRVPLNDSAAVEIFNPGKLD